METIKMSLEITLNFSKSAQTFIKSLITAQNGAPDKPEKAAPDKPEKVAPDKSEKAAPDKSEKAAPDKPENNVTIEDVRIELAKKVKDHRDEIKQKLNEFGAPSVTKLNPEKYNEMIEFLNTL